jgi:ribosome maturation factor RimP
MWNTSGKPGAGFCGCMLINRAALRLGDCSLISSQLGDILDLKLETEDSYTLEVSSPGMDRPVSKLSDFEKFNGERAKIKIAQPINGQKKFKGVLCGIMESISYS